MRELPKIISVDDHVVEPPHVWQTWLPEKWRSAGRGWSARSGGKFKLYPGARYAMEEEPDGQWGDAWYLGWQVDLCAEAVRGDPVGGDARR